MKAKVVIGTGIAVAVALLFDIWFFWTLFIFYNAASLDAMGIILPVRIFLFAIMTVISAMLVWLINKCLDDWRA